MSATDHPLLMKQIAFVERATVILSKNERVRILWLTGSLAKGTADAQSDVDLRAVIRPRMLEAAQLLFDKDEQAQNFNLISSSQLTSYVHLPTLVEEFIRPLGMLPIVVERHDVPIGMEGQLAFAREWN